MKNNTRSGAALAIAAVSLALAGATPAAAATPAKVHCLGEQLQGQERLHDPEEQLQKHERLQGPGLGIRRSEKACADAGGKVMD